MTAEAKVKSCASNRENGLKKWKETQLVDVFSLHSLMIKHEDD